MIDIDTYEFVSMARGYHQYQSIWSAVIGEELPCRIELSNPHDLFAVGSHLQVRHCSGPRTEKNFVLERFHRCFGRLEILQKRVHF